MHTDSPSKIDKSESERLNLQKYAEKLKASLKKIDKTYSVRYDRKKQILDVIGGTGIDRRTLIVVSECDSTRLKNVYCALSLQCYGQFESWRDAIRDGEIRSYETVPTP